MMTIQGNVNEWDVVRMMLAREYAFVLYYGKNSAEYEIRIGHKQGTWSVARMLNGSVCDFFTFDDADAVSTTNPLLSGFIEAKKELCDIPYNHRDRQAEIILPVLQLWIGNGMLITTLVLSPRRNSTVDEFTGNLSVVKT